MIETADQRPSKETAQRVIDAYLISGDADMLVGLVGAKAKSSLSVALIEDALAGLRSVTSACGLPYYLISYSVQQSRFQGFHSAERIRSLIDIEHGQKPSVEAETKALKIANEKMDEFAYSDEGVTEFRNRIVCDLDRHLSSEKVAEAASELLVQALISAWAVFESSVSSFIRAWINDDPQRAKPVLAAADLKSYFGKQVVDLSVIGDHSFNLSASMGDILFRDRRLDNLGVIRSVLDALFEDPQVRKMLGDDMWMLNQRRHLFVHKRGLVDTEYVTRTGDSLPLGKRLLLTSGNVEHYIGTVEGAVLAISNAADRKAEGVIELPPA